MSCDKLKNFLNNIGIQTKSVKKVHIFCADYYLLYTVKYDSDYISSKLDVHIEKMPSFYGCDSSCFAISVKDGDRLLNSCGFNFLDALGESNREELIKRQLIIHGSGNKDTRVKFKKGNMVLLYNTMWSSSCVANALNICDDSVVDVSADSCGDLKMIVLLDRVGKYTYKPKPMPLVKFCENDFDLKKDALDMPHPHNCIRKQLEKNCIDCGHINISSDDIIRIGTIAETNDIATALNIPAKSVVDLVDKKYILLDRVLRKVKSK